MSEKKRRPVRCTVKVEGGGKIKVYDDTEITCETHGVKYRYGDLDQIQQLAFVEGIDVEGDKCIFDSARITAPTPEPVREGGKER